MPIAVQLQVLDAHGRPDTSRSGTALVLVDDDRATVTLGSGAASLRGASATGGVRVPVPLAAGAAGLTITFARLGPHTLFASLQADANVGGESDVLQVRPTFLTIQASPQAQQGSPTQVSIVAHDDTGQPVVGYAEPALLTTDDGQALLVDVAAPAAPAKGSAAHQFEATDEGQAHFAVTFAASSTHRLEARTPADVSPAASATLNVVPSVAQPAPASALPGPPLPPAPILVPPSAVTNPPHASELPAFSSSAPSPVELVAAHTSASGNGTREGGATRPLDQGAPAPLALGSPSFSVTMSASSTMPAFPSRSQRRRLIATGCSIRRTPAPSSSVPPTLPLRLARCIPIPSPRPMPGSMSSPWPSTRQARPRR